MRGWLAGMLWGVAVAAGAQVPQGQTPVAKDRTNIKTSAQLDQEAKEADALYQQSRALDALPLYEDLLAQRPGRVFYMERLGTAYLAKSGALRDKPEQAAAARAEAKRLLLAARAAGDNSDLVQVLLAKLDELEKTPVQTAAKPAGEATLNEAELAFNKGDLKGAMALYNKAWGENARLYQVPLFAGDAEYRQGHFDEAGVWFARAIAISPDVETAHRYWADCLAKAGRAAEARTQYVEAFVAEPYAKAPRLVLKTWAGKNGLQYAPPPVVIPIQMTREPDGSYRENVDKARLSDPNYLAWIPYPLHSATWRVNFARVYPNEKTYRHSLAEETDALKTLLKVVRADKRSPDTYDATIRSLMALEKDGMLECWILLDNPDQGVAQDYAAYRAGHRELLQAYVEKYDLHAVN